MIRVGSVVKVFPDYFHMTPSPLKRRELIVEEVKDELLVVSVRLHKRSFAYRPVEKSMPACVGSPENNEHIYLLFSVPLSMVEEVGEKLQEVI